ncbi:MAG: CRISPR-associated endonuclease Cas1 [Acidimicrobiales bacterium]
MSAPRVVYQSKPLTDEDVAEDRARRADAYSRPDSEHVAVVDGFGARVAVERGHLELHDGVGPDRRLRRYSKIDPPRRVVVGIGTVGAVSLDALRWCSSVGTPLVVLSNDGAILAAGPPGRDDARLLRAQALALYGPVGVEIARWLVGAKLAGQAKVLRLHVHDEQAASMIEELRAVLETVGSIEAVRQTEGAAANAYFAAWERTVVVTFARKDLPRIDERWSKFNGRRSSVNPGSPRSATDPAGAVMNYAYKLAEIEAGLAARRMGLSVSVGILHADHPGRPSFACDLMEAVRPVVDAHVLGVLAGPLRKREFTEDARGVVRCLAPLTIQLAEAMPSYAVVLAPVTETVAGLLAESSPYNVTVPSVLSGAKHKAAARRRVDAERRPTRDQGPNPGGLPPRGRKRRAEPSATPPLPAGSCRGCGAILPVDSDRPRSRRNWCEECLPGRRAEIIPDMRRIGRTDAQAVAGATGVLPSHTTDAQAARSVANARQRAEETAWAARTAATALTGDDGVAWWRERVLPKLATVTLPAMARATGASTSAASKWRAGRTVPHRRHWPALAELVGVKLPGGRGPYRVLSTSKRRHAETRRLSDGSVVTVDMRTGETVAETRE